MGRPSKKYVDYFPHDSDASDRQTIFILEANFANDGYAFWFKLLEILARKEGHFLDLRNGNELLFFSAKTHISVEKTELILNLLAKLGAIDPELWSQKVVWSQNFLNRLQVVYDKRKETLPLRPLINNVSGAGTIVSDTETQIKGAESTQSKVKERKGKEKTLVQIGETFARFWNAYPRKQGKAPALKAWSKIKDIESKFDCILKALRTACQDTQWLKENGQYIPMPATWINQERWTDEYRTKKETDSNPYTE